MQSKAKQLLVSSKGAHIAKTGERNCVVVHGRKLASPGWAPERVTTGPWRYLNPLSSVPGPGKTRLNVVLSVSAGVETGEAGAQGRSQSLVRPTLILLMTLKAADAKFVSAGVAESGLKPVL